MVKDEPDQKARLTKVIDELLERANGSIGRSNCALGDARSIDVLG
jgi:hypothetical protein